MTLNFQINKTFNYGWVKTVSYNIYLDEDLSNQLNQTFNTANGGVILDKTIVLGLENTSQGNHTIRVLMLISNIIQVHGFPFTTLLVILQRLIIATCAREPVTDNTTRQTTDSLGVSILAGGVAVISTITIYLLLYHRHKKTSNLKQ